MKYLFSNISSLITGTIIAVAICFYFHIHGFLIAILISLSWFVIGKLEVTMFFMRGQPLFALIKLFELRFERREEMLSKNIIQLILVYLRLILVYLNFITLRRLKMPLRFAILFSIVLIPTIALVYLAFIYIPGHTPYSYYELFINNLRALVWVIIFSESIAFTHWAFYWPDYFFGSEYDARRELIQKGYSPTEIEQKIVALKEWGIFGPEIRTT